MANDDTENGRTSHEERPQEWTPNGQYVDSHVYSISPDMLELLTHREFLAASHLSGVTIHLKNKVTGELQDIDINQIKQQGVKIGVFRCPVRTCKACFTRRPLVERHFLSQHRDLVEQGESWKSHPTCSTYSSYGQPKSAYYRRPKAEIDQLRADNNGRLPRISRAAANKQDAAQTPPVAGPKRAVGDPHCDLNNSESEQPRKKMQLSPGPTGLALVSADVNEILKRDSLFTMEMDEVSKLNWQLWLEMIRMV